MKKMNFDFLVDYIENNEVSTEIASKKMNQFIYFVKVKKFSIFRKRKR